MTDTVIRGSFDVIESKVPKGKPLDARGMVLRELGEFCAGFVPYQIDGRYALTAGDGRELIADLEAFARKVDRVIAAYGEYCESEIASFDEAKLFTDQLTDALTGNALFQIESAVEEEIEAQEELAEHGDPDYRYEQRRDDAAWDR